MALSSIAGPIPALLCYLVKFPQGEILGCVNKINLQEFRFWGEDRFYSSGHLSRAGPSSSPVPPYLPVPNLKDPASLSGLGWGHPSGTAELLVFLSPVFTKGRTLEVGEPHPNQSPSLAHQLNCAQEFSDLVTNYLFPKEQNHYSSGLTGIMPTQKH